MKLLILSLVVFIVVIEAGVPGPYIKPGACPVPRKYFLKICRRRRDFCTTDTSCRGDLKCCEQPCGKRCVRPDPFTISQPSHKDCLAFDPFVKVNCPSTFFSCRNDGECSPVEQCCPGPCGNTCLRKPHVCSTTPCADQGLAIKCGNGMEMEERDVHGCRLCNCRMNITTPCPPGVNRVKCFVHPCLLSTCDNPAAHRCRPDYCGGCKAVYYDVSGNKVECN